MHGYDLPGETAQLGNKKHTYMMSVAQLQQHSSGGDVGGPEEAPLVAPATLPLACVFLKWTTVTPGGTTQQK